MELFSKGYLYLLITVQDSLTGYKGSNEAALDRKWKSLLWLRTLLGLLIRSSFFLSSLFDCLLMQSKELLTRIFTATTIAPMLTRTNSRFIALSRHSVVIIPRLSLVWEIQSITKCVSSWWSWDREVALPSYLCFLLIAKCFIQYYIDRSNPKLYGSFSNCLSSVFNSFYQLIVNQLVSEYLWPCQCLWESLPWDQQKLEEWRHPELGWLHYWLVSLCSWFLPALCQQSSWSALCSLSWPGLKCLILWPINHKLKSRVKKPPECSACSAEPSFDQFKCPFYCCSKVKCFPEVMASPKHLPWTMIKQENVSRGSL